MVEEQRSALEEGKRVKVATTLLGFAAGVAATVGALAIYGVALCP